MIACFGRRAISPSFITMPSMPKIVFVCYGNICRSPFAEHYARKRYQELGLSHILFLSAGVGAVPGT
ncbi:MAG: hypothetical protein RBU30_01930, partial [Polyangia bacterium]|nr:hypothetical protein [Polyangia bacterium]